MIISELLNKGIVPVIAHPERNDEFRQNLELLTKLVNQGCWVQLTAQSLTGHFGKSIQATSLKILDLKLAHIVASDAHRIDGRSPDLSRVYSMIVQQYSAATAKLLLETNPLRLINGQKLIDLNLDHNSYEIASDTSASKTGSSLSAKLLGKLFK